MSIEDKLEIKELFGKYALTVDGYDADAWGQLFTDDGVFEIEAGRNGARLQFRGRDAIVSFMRAHIELVPGTRHIQAGHVTRVFGDEAVDHCTLGGLLNRPDKVYIFASGWYETKLNKVSGTWKIAHRIAHCDNFEPAQFAEGELVHLFGELNDWVGKNCMIADGPATVGASIANMPRG